MRVTVFDPRDGIIDKACGEGIMPAGVKALAELGIYPKGVCLRGVCYVDADGSQTHAVGSFRRGHGLGVRRTTLHSAMMLRALELGVRFERAAVRTFRQSRDGVVVNDELHARWLIGADGLRSRIRRELGVERPGRRRSRFGLRRHYTIAGLSDRVEVQFGDGVEAYVTPVDTDLVCLAFLFDTTGTPERDFEELIAGFPLVADRFRKAERASRVRGAGPFEQRVDRRVVDHVLLVGDAAGYLDPLTGDGIALGLATARAAVMCLLASTPWAYEDQYRRITRPYVLVTSCLRAIACCRAANRAFLRLASACPSVFDDVLAILANLPHAETWSSSSIQSSLRLRIGNVEGGS
jgi:flavin-dependent dehydrogenase